MNTAEALIIAVGRLEDILKNDDGQAWKEAEKVLPQLQRAAAEARQLATEQAVPSGEPVKFLANGTRFKMSFLPDDDGEDVYVTCFNNFEEELDGRWVALVPAEDDCHRKLTTPTPTRDRAHANSRRGDCPSLRLDS